MYLQSVAAAAFATAEDSSDLLAFVQIGCAFGPPTGWCSCCTASLHESSETALSLLAAVAVVGILEQSSLVAAELGGS